MPSDITNPEIIRFLVENYDKTARLRMRWNEQHTDELKVTATFRGPEKGYKESDVAETCIVSGMATITRDHISAGTNRKLNPIRDSKYILGVADLKKGHSITEMGLGNAEEDPRLTRPDTDTLPDPLMRPVPPRQKQILYDCLPNFGRRQYLNVRNGIKPEKKYYFPETRGWEYGWRLKDSYFGRQLPTYPRVAKMSVESRCRTGPQPDPEHYQVPDKKDFKCTSI